MRACVHHIEGRLRIRLPELKSSPHNITEIAQAISTIFGVRSVQIKPLTGSVVIHYDHARTDLPALRAALGQVLQCQTLPLPPAPNAGTAVADKVLSTVLEKLIERSAMALVGALI